MPRIDFYLPFQVLSLFFFHGVPEFQCAKRAILLKKMQNIEKIMFSFFFVENLKIYLLTHFTTKLVDRKSFSLTLVWICRQQNAKNFCTNSKLYLLPRFLMEMLI